MEKTIKIEINDDEKYITLISPTGDRLKIKYFNEKAVDFFNGIDIPSNEIQSDEIVSIKNKSTENYSNPLKDPANHNIIVLLKELKFGRPAKDQIFIDECIRLFYDSPTAKI